jgi:hypothetical protein
MPFDASGLLSFGTGGGYPYSASTKPRSKLWHYISNDSLATIAGANYFASAAPQMNKGDIIIVSAAAGGTLAVRTYGVATSDNVSAITLIKDDTA